MLFFQTLLEIIGFSIARTGHRNAKLDYADNEEQLNHIEAVWMLFIVLNFLFMVFTGILLAYHTYLLISGQTTWEHSSRMLITYLRPYKLGQMPFYKGILGNLKSAFLHGNSVVEWKLIDPVKLR